MESLKRVERRKTKKGGDLKVQRLELVTSAAEESEIVLHEVATVARSFLKTNQAGNIRTTYITNSTNKTS